MPKSSLVYGSSHCIIEPYSLHRGEAMIISGELAQHIANKIIPIVRQNINIMDNTGMIIGSGQPHRLHTFHQGAKEVLATGVIIEIYPEHLERYPGSLPGINWPIVLGQQTIGVVGISGHPDTVRQAAELATVVIELILEYEVLKEEFRSQSQLHEQFIVSILSEQAYANSPQIAARADLLHFNLSLPRLVAVTNIQPIFEIAYTSFDGLHDLVSFRTYENLMQLITASGLIGPKDLAAFLDNELIILKHFPESAVSEDMIHWGQDIIRVITPPGNISPLTLGLGSLSPSPWGLHASCQEARFLSRKPIRSHSVSSIYYPDLLVNYLLANPAAINTCSVFQQLSQKITGKIDYKYDMKKTVCTLLEENLNLSATARALYVHRNTLQFRLEKFKQLTGLEPCQSINHAILCKLLYL